MQRFHGRCMPHLPYKAAALEALKRNDVPQMKRYYAAWELTVTKYVPIVCKQFYQSLSLSSSELMSMTLRVKY